MSTIAIAISDLRPPPAAGGYEPHAKLRNPHPQRHDDRMCQRRRLPKPAGTPSRRTGHFVVGRHALGSTSTRRGAHRPRTTSCSCATGLRQRSGECRCLDLVRTPDGIPGQVPRSHRYLHEGDRGASQRCPPIPSPGAPLHQRTPLRFGNFGPGACGDPDSGHGGPGRAGRPPQRPQHPHEHPALQHLVSRRPRVLSHRTLRRGLTGLPRVPAGIEESRRPRRHVVLALHDPAVPGEGNRGE